MTGGITLCRDDRRNTLFRNGKKMMGMARGTDSIDSYLNSTIRAILNPTGIERPEANSL